MKGGAKRAQAQSPKSLRDEVREALLTVLRDPKASPTARAIAGRSLMQIMSDYGEPDELSAAAEMTVEELDDEIAKLNASPQKER